MRDLSEAELNLVSGGAGDGEEDLEERDIIVVRAKERFVEGAGAGAGGLAGRAAAGALFGARFGPAGMIIGAGLGAAGAGAYFDAAGRGHTRTATCEEVEEAIGKGARCSAGL